LKKKKSAGRIALQFDVITIILFSVIVSVGSISLFAQNDTITNHLNLPQVNKTIVSIPLFDSTVNETSSNQMDLHIKDSISNKTRINKLKNTLISKITIVQNDESGNTKEDKSQNLISSNGSFKGKVIRKIGFKQLEIFGQSVNDTNQMPTRWLEKLGNGLHIHSQEYILKNQLLIKPGEALDLYLLAENERLIRELPYIDDASTILSAVGNDSVDIIIITKDVLPLGFGLELLDVTYGRASIFDKNLLGLGHELNYTLTWNYNRNPFYGHKLRYRIQNIGSSFFSLDASYENQWNIEARRIYIDRDFYSQSTKYAGGIGFEKIYSIKDIKLPDTLLSEIKVDYNFYDYWIGRAIHLNNATISKSRTNIAITARMTQYEFFRRPKVGEKLLYDFHNRTTCLASFGISRQGYYKSNLIYGFGRTEDVPYGFAYALTGGIEFNEFYNRPYFGLNFTHGSHLKKIGYLRKQLAFGGFINNELEQGLLQVQLNYFSDLINEAGRYAYRIFADMQYMAGYNRFEDEYMEFTKRDGIRGLASDELRGNQRLNFNLEPVCYSPHRLLGFRFIYYLFIDAGIIANNSTILINNPIYSGFGAGVRIRNDNLVFDAIHLRIGYYPLLPKESVPEYILLTSNSNRRFSNFMVPKPDILRYQTRL
jgi:hypothetical protein